MTAPIIFDRKLYAARRLRAARAGTECFLVRQSGENLAERVAALNRRPYRALDLGSRAESFALVAPAADNWVRTFPAAGETAASVVADEEMLPFAPNSFDLVVSVLALHAVNDLPGTLVQIKRALAPGGLFLGALFGGNTLTELRRAFAAGEAETSGGASPRVAPLTDVRDAGGLLQRAGFDRPVADVERVTVRYRSFVTLADDLRCLGETNALMQRRRSALSRRMLTAALAHYMEQDGDADGRLRATFDILYLTGWAPAPVS
ncbi:MAG TPA: methyltransferase domain-containing protein [Rhizomicrobium sp.]|nr:methyltransferase domain-containing protein [Rhizomicrobium sp.]